MKDLLAFLIMFGALVGVWYWMAGKFRRKGSGAITRHLAGGVCGVGAFLIAGIAVAAFGLLDPDSTDSQPSLASSGDEQNETIDKPADQVDAPEAKEIAEVSTDSGAAVAETVEESDPTPEPEPEANSIAQQRAEIEAGPDISMDVATFTRRFNQAMSQAEMPYRLNGRIPQLEDDHVQRSFHETLNDNLVVVLTVKPESDAIRDVMVIGTGDGTMDSGARVMLTASSAFMASDPDASLRDGLLMASDMAGDYVDGGEEVKIVRKGLAYTYSRNDLFGNMFSVSPVKD